MKSPEAGVLVRAFLAGFHEKLRRTGGERLSVGFLSLADFPPGTMGSYESWAPITLPKRFWGSGMILST